MKLKALFVSIILDQIINIYQHENPIHVYLN